MDKERFEELKTKAAGEGLSDEEAAELGRLYAEEAGEPYGDADSAADAEHESADEENRARRELDAGREAQAEAEDHRAHASQPGIVPDAGADRTG
jgi:hypothetical protein